LQERDVSKFALATLCTVTQCLYCWGEGVELFLITYQLADYLLFIRRRGSEWCTSDLRLTSQF